VEQSIEEAGDRGFLAAVLRTRAGENAADFSF
jgi:hypothetical protein